MEQVGEIKGEKGREGDASPIETQLVDFPRMVTCVSSRDSSSPTLLFVKSRSFPLSLLFPRRLKTVLPANLILINSMLCSCTPLNIAPRSHRPRYKRSSFCSRNLSVMAVPMHHHTHPLKLTAKGRRELGVRLNMCEIFQRDGIECCRLHFRSSPLRELAVLARTGTSLPYNGCCSAVKALLPS